MKYILAIIALFCLNCGATQNRCLVEQSIVTGLAGAHDSIQTLELTEEVEKYVDAYKETIDIGSAAVDLCMAVRDKEAFYEWIPLGIKAVLSIIAILDEFGIDVPPIIRNVIDIMDIVNIGKEDDKDNKESFESYWNSRDSTYFDNLTSYRGST